jgi:hypothetical protein
MENPDVFGICFPGWSFAIDENQRQLYSLPTPAWSRRSPSSPACAATERPEAGLKMDKFTATFPLGSLLIWVNVCYIFN